MAKGSRVLVLAKVCRLVGGRLKNCAAGSPQCLFLESASVGAWRLNILASLTTFTRIPASIHVTNIGCHQAFIFMANDQRLPKCRQPLAEKSTFINHESKPYEAHR
jgi:hypothetical protein